VTAAASAPSLRRRLGAWRRRALSWWWSRTKSRIGGVPWIYYPLHRILVGRKWASLETTTDCDLVVEGAQRSATTFATAALQVASPGGLRIAHHLHVPVQIKKAARLGLPALVLIRDPEAAVRSLLLYDPYLDAGSALRAYRSFYAGCLPYAESFVVATFEEATGDMAAVTARINARFGTSFAAYLGEAELRERIDKVLERNNRNRDSGNPFTSYLPNPVKEAAKAKIDLTAQAGLLADCQALYARYRELAARS
jgi:hypothetical protein